MSRFYSRPFLAIVTGFATIWMLVGTYADENKAKDSTPAATVESATDALRVPSFVLRDTKGELRGLADFDKAEFLVLVFMGTQCPIANGYVPDLNAMAERYKDKKVQFIGINSTLSDDAKAIKKHAEEFKISFPVLIDDEQLAADVCGATRTPEVFVLDHRRTIRYQGRIDDRIGYTYKRDKARRADLDLALGELTSKKKVSVAKTKPSGCLITRESSLQEKGRITYAKDVASILHKRCANCHHPGTAAPFSLLTYDQARNWSEMIKETIVLRRMPPWDADPRFGHFSNDLSMPKKEIDTVVAWIDSGAPLGDKKKSARTTQVCRRLANR